MPIELDGSDAGTGVTGWLVSEVPLSPNPSDERWAPVAPAAVTLTPGDGTKRVYVWTMDGAGNVSVPSAPKTLLDTTPPSGGAAPVVTIRGPGTGAAPTVPLTVTWAAAIDAQPGRVHYELRMRAGAAGPAPVVLAKPEATSTSLALKPGDRTGSRSRPLTGPETWGRGGRHPSQPSSASSRRRRRRSPTPAGSPGRRCRARPVASSGPRGPRAGPPRSRSRRAAWRS